MTGVRRRYATAVVSRYEEFGLVGGYNTMCEGHVAKSLGESPISSAILSYYAAAASTYDLRPRSARRMRDVSLIREATKCHLRGLNVLEVAPGTGEWTEHIARIAVSVVALDASEAMLRVARARCAPLQNVNLARGDAYRFPFRDRSFNGAFAGWWFSHVPRSQVTGFMSALHAKLRPNSVVMLADDTPAVVERLTDADDAGDTHALRATPDGRCFRIVKNLYSREELYSLVEPAATALNYVEGECHWGPC